nr:NEW3 domain-containing protein [uncultured Pseudogulbenkiania sp.]
MLRHSGGLSGLRVGLHYILMCCWLTLLFFASPSFAQPAASLSQSPQAASAAQSVQLQGTLEVLHEDDFKNKKSRTRHFLKTESGERYELKFKGKVPPHRSGTKLRVKGVKSSNLVYLDTSGSTSGSIQVLAQAAMPNTLGEQKTLVILANFQDQPTNYTNSYTGQPITLSGANSLVFGTGQGTVNGFYTENSYQQTTIVGNTIGWYTLPLNSTMSTCDTASVATYAKQAATAAGVDLSLYTRYVYVTPYIAACGFAGASMVGGNEAWINGLFSVNVIAHELGHNLGLEHSHGLYCSNGSIIGNGVLFPISNNTACTMVQYGDTLDTMGAASQYNAPHFNAFQKERLGWLNNSGMPPITTVTTSGTYTIDPYEPSGTNPKALKIFKGLDAYGYKTWYYVEFRQAIGFDSGPISGSYPSVNSGNILSGVVVHAYSENNGGGSGYLLDMTPATIEYNAQDPALGVGQSFSDPAAGVTISTAWANGSNAGVTVTLSGSASTTSTCTRANPSVVLSSSQSTSVAAGTAVTYTVAVANNDNSACSASAFNLQSSLPSGWTGTLGSSVLTISPGGTGSTTLTVTSAATALAGTYTIVATAANSASASYSGSGSAAYSVGSTTTTSTKGKGRIK